MTCCIISLVTVQKFYGYSIYETKLMRKGIRMVRGHDVNLLRSMQVGDYMDSEFETIREGMRLGEVLKQAEVSPYPHFPVLNDQAKMVGILSMSDLRSFLAEVGELCELVVASEIMTSRVIVVHPDDNFETAFEIFEGKQISTLPVVSKKRSAAARHPEEERPAARLQPEDSQTERHPAELMKQANHLLTCFTTGATASRAERSALIKKPPPTIKGCVVNAALIIYR